MSSKLRNPKQLALSTRLPSIEAYLKYGVRPSTLRYLLQNKFNFPTAYKDCLEPKGYKLIFWSTDFFIHAIKEGTIQRGNVTFQVVFSRTTFGDIQKAANRNPWSQVALSFRIPAKEYKEVGIQPTVMVRRTGIQS